MTRARYIVPTLLCGWFSAVVMADIPTTQPLATTQPAVAIRPRQPVPAGWIKIENPTHHFFYFVPKNWRADGHSDAQVNFMIPDSQGHQIGQLMVECVLGCHEQTLEAVAAAQKAAMPKLQPNAKLVHDEMTQMGNRPAWMFVTQETQQGTMMTSRGPMKYVEKAEFTSWVAIEGQMYYYVNVFSQAQDYTRNIAFARRVVDTMEWTNIAPTTQP
jgi:hypothetical protein